jgi:putative transposase
VTELCRAMGVTEQTYYRWKKQYGGLAVHEIRRLRLLKDKKTYRLRLPEPAIRRC